MSSFYFLVLTEVHAWRMSTLITMFKDELSVFDLFNKIKLYKKHGKWENYWDASYEEPKSFGDTLVLLWFVILGEVGYIKNW